MARARDYKAEYQRRIANAAKRGLSRSQARGHTRPGEAALRPKPIKDAERLNAAFNYMRDAGSLTAAAKTHRISPERLRRFVRENSLAERKGRFWTFSDTRLREMLVLSNGEAIRVKLAGRDQAALNGAHLNAAKNFVRTNDIELLVPFEGKSVIDAKGKTYPLETDPNLLHRIAASGSEQFHDIYRLIF